MTSKTRHLHALLFSSPGGLDIQSIQEMCDISSTELTECKEELLHFLENTGVELIEHKNQLQLGVRTSALPKSYTEKISSDTLSTAALEVLAIIAYRQPISRAEIEELRGIGAQQSLRGLLEKELIEEQRTKKSGITHLQYVTTAQFLQHMGLNKITDLPQLREQS